MVVVNDLDPPGAEHGDELIPVRRGVVNAPYAKGPSPYGKVLGLVAILESSWGSPEGLGDVAPRNKSPGVGGRNKASSLLR